MIFYSPTDEPIHVSLLTGHATLVTKEGADIDNMFYAKAFELGCVTQKPLEGQSVQLSDDEELIIAEVTSDAKKRGRPAQ